MTSLLGDADVVLAVQPPGPEIIYAMKPGATLSYFIYESNEPTLVQRSRERHQSGMSRNGSSR